MIRIRKPFFAALMLAPLLAMAQGLVQGADVSWLTQQEAAGYTFQDAQGHPADPFALVKQAGADAVRLRVWVNPSPPWCDESDTLAKAARAKASGLRVMIDFHYSDTWADPGHQKPPVEWQGYSQAEMARAVADHTRRVLKRLQAQGIAVEWVQVGNEINSGMLWPSGRLHRDQPDPAPLVALINAGYDAVKSVYPKAAVIVHIAGGDNNSLFRHYFDTLKSAGARWDVIGMSHYPPKPSGWRQSNDLAIANLQDMIKRYGKPVMIVETGMPWSESAADTAMVADLASRMRAIGPMAAGLFYWEPTGNPQWRRNKGAALGFVGQFNPAIQAFH